MAVGVTKTAEALSVLSRSLLYSTEARIHILKMFIKYLKIPDGCCRCLSASKVKETPGCLGERG